MNYLLHYERKRRDLLSYFGAVSLSQNMKKKMDILAHKFKLLFLNRKIYTGPILRALDAVDNLFLYVIFIVVILRNLPFPICIVMLNA
jgi:hypothetical protein